MSALQWSSQASDSLCRRSSSVTGRPRDWPEPQCVAYGASLPPQATHQQLYCLCSSLNPPRTMRSPDESLPKSCSSHWCSYGGLSQMHTVWAALDRYAPVVIALLQCMRTRVFSKFVQATAVQPFMATLQCLAGFAPLYQASGKLPWKMLWSMLRSGSQP